MWLRGAVICALLVGFAARTAPSSAWAGDRQRAGYRIIVNPANGTDTVDETFVAQAFLKKVQRWTGGEAIHPVDLAPDSPVRRQWSADVLQRSVEAVKSYWQQMIFSGRAVPPPELPSDDDVVSYVLRTPGSIGYVSADANLRGAKPISVR